EFTTLFAEKPEAALLKYTAGLVKNKKAFSDVSASLKDAGEEGARVVSTITALGQKTAFFTGKINDSTIALQGYSEINAAFALKNETLGAKLDKLGKDFNALSNNKTLVDMLTKLVIVTSDFVGWINKNMEAIRNITKVIIIAGVAWGAYRIAVFLAKEEKLAWIKTLISAETLETLAIARTTLWGLVTATLSGNFKKAGQELKLLATMMNVTPWGIAIAAVAALGTALYLYSGKVTTSAKIQGDFNDVQAETKKRYEQETETLKRLDKIRTDANSTLAQKAAAIKKINELYPSILSGLTAEEALTNKGTDAIKKYLVELDKKINAEVALDKIKELKNKNLDLSSSDGSKGSYLNETFQSVYGAIGADSQVKRLRGYNKSNNKEEITANNARISELQKQYGASIMAGDLSTQGGATGSYTIESEADKKAREKSEKKAESEAEKAAKKILADKKKLQEDLNKIAEDVFNKQLSDQYREIAQTRNKYDELEKLAHGDAELLEKLEIQQQEELIEIGKKYAEKAKEEAKKQFAEKLKQIEEFQKIKEDLYRSNLTADQQLEAGAGDAYENAWKQLYAFHEAKVITDAEFAEVERQLQEKLANDIAGIRTKSAKATQQEINDFMIGSAQLVSDTVFTIMGNSARAQSDDKLDRINSDREKELSHKNLTEAQKKKINDKYDAQVRAEKRRAWAAEQRAAVAQAVINGAIGVTAALTNPLTASFVVPMIIATTAAQIAVIAAQPVPKFAKGGFTTGEAMYQSTTGRPFIAGEAGTEWIAPNWMTTDPRTANIINTLEAMRQNRSFANGGFTANSTATNTLPFGEPVGSKSSTAGFDEMKELLVRVEAAVLKSNDKKVTLVYQDFEKFQAETIQVRNNVTG
ncbi:MAG: hypothetical protein H7325_09655, partial [Pedobacter sp.]|nr:hypothetical protein [Pedobacter sp.]